MVLGIITVPLPNQDLTEISVGLHLLDIAKISEVEHSFIIDFYLGSQSYNQQPS
ncbi:hypothetical protein ETSB_0936 [cyanobacterium endosymbiont of Epithemia turgida isolate EtSB Lake Yunoko]|nr:hypothetical protein ETSB_0936 [cyanobacterium endosymbiont of Epithemia turgida isolate EtSB Lake Yunoko]